MGLRTWRGRATPPPRWPHPPEHNLIQRPDLLRALANRMGMKQAHVTPALNEGVQAVVVIDSLPAPQADSARVAARGNVSGSTGDAATLMSCVGVWNRPGSLYTLNLLDWRGYTEGIAAVREVLASVQTDNGASYSWPTATPYETFYLDTPTTLATNALLSDPFVVIGGRRSSVSTSTGLLWSQAVDFPTQLVWTPLRPVLVHPGEIMTIQLQSISLGERLRACSFLIELIERK